MPSNTRRVFPIACTSAYCGRTDCTGCPRKPTLDAFNQWCKDTNAEPADPIWSPLVYIAKRQGSADETHD